MSAPDLTDAERATVDRFDAAPDAPESLRERVAQGIWDSRGYNTRWFELNDTARAMFLSFADAAIAVMRGQA